MVRLFCEQGGENPQIVLEDIAAILKGTDSENEEAIALIEEKLREAQITPAVYESLRLVDPNEFEEFYLQSDEVADPAIYGTLGKWWNKLRYAIEKNVAHLGESVIELSTWEELQPKARSVFGSEYNKEITIREWAAKLFKLDVPWILTVITTDSGNAASYTTTINMDREPEKKGTKEYNNQINIHTPQNLIPVTTRVKGLLERPKAFVEKARDNKKIQSAIQNDEELVRHQKSLGRSTEQIIQDVWGMTPQSHLVDWDEEVTNYQYEILSTFVNSVRLKNGDVRTSN